MTIQVRFDDDNVIDHEPGPLRELVASYDVSISKRMIAVMVNGHAVDCESRLDQDATLKPIMSEDPEGLEIIRHSAAHLLAQAVKELFPDVQVTIGPVIEDGFYYDFYYPEHFKPEDIQRIEQRMRKLAKRNLPIERIVMSREEAIELFESMGEDFKVEIIKEIPQSDDISLYKQGDFIDLCRGPHVPSTGKLGAFKLTKLAGSYWRGESDQAVLQRIYGTAWPTQTELESYLDRIEQAKKRDHRVLAKKMDLFHTDEIAPGMIFWHPNGWYIYRQLIAYVRKIMEEYGYQEVLTPQLVDQSLWERSGHWDKFQDDMFVLDMGDKTTVIKPMNCPCHVEIYKHSMRSYRCLPLRLSEFGSCHRNEPSGTLHGIMRIRNFIQDDGHIFCMSSQIEQEVSAFIEQAISLYKVFGFKQNDILIYLSTRPDIRVGSDEVWDKSEAILIDLLNQTDITWELNQGEGAFYGPKIEISLRDSMARVWQCGTIQLDFSMPERLGAVYTGQDGEKYVPVMLHRAMLGSVERFLAILLEETEGSLPLWMMPYHVILIGVTDKQHAYLATVSRQIEGGGFRVQIDTRNEKVGYKVREHSIARMPYLMICGPEEEANGTVSVRTWAGQDLGVMTVDHFIDSQQSALTMP